METVTIVGGGMFGVTAALELQRRGHSVTVVDPGPLPHPDASSTDTSKAVRMDYGDDAFYVKLAELALAGWHAWNREWGEELYHEVGILLLSRASMDAGGFESSCYALLSKRGVALERMDVRALARRFPAWADVSYADGYFNPRAGWVESGRVMARLITIAKSRRIAFREGARCTAIVRTDGRVSGVRLERDEILRSDSVIVAAGAWTPMLLPQLASVMWATGQPVGHFVPPDGRLYAGERFPVWCADIANSGWYGFPISAEGTLKVGNHGPGRRFAAGDALAVTPDEAGAFPGFVARTFPGLAHVPLLRTRLCLYSDTWDGDFLVDYDPERPGLFVACGGSGHAFKFAPIMGGIVADVFERRENPWAARFAWRKPGERRYEGARHAE